MLRFPTLQVCPRVALDQYPGRRYHTLVTVLRAFNVLEESRLGVYEKRFMMLESLDPGEEDCLLLMYFTQT